MHTKNGTRINGKRIEMREASAVERTWDLGSRKMQEISERAVPRKERLKGSERLEEEEREGMESRWNKWGWWRWWGGDERFFVKLGRSGDWHKDGRNEEEQESSRSSWWLRCGPLECQWLIKVLGGSGAWRANTSSCCAVIEGLALPQGLANTDYYESYRGIVCFERVLHVFANQIQNPYLEKNQNYRHSIIQSSSLRAFPFTPENTLKTVRGVCLDFSEKLSWWQSSWHKITQRKPNRKLTLFSTCFSRTLQQLIFHQRGSPRSPMQQRQQATRCIYWQGFMFLIKAESMCNCLRKILVIISRT